RRSRTASRACARTRRGSRAVAARSRPRSWSSSATPEASAYRGLVDPPRWARWFRYARWRSLLNQRVGSGRGAACLDARDERVERLQVAAQEAGRAVVGDFALVGEEAGSRLDEALRLAEGGRVVVAQ